MSWASSLPLLSGRRAPLRFRPGPALNGAPCRSSAQRYTPSAAVGEGTGPLSQSRRLAARKLARRYAWTHHCVLSPARACGPSPLLRSEPHPEQWLLIEWPKTEKEPTKYWLSTCRNPSLCVNWWLWANSAGSSNVIIRNSNRNLVGPFRRMRLARLSSPCHARHRLRLPGAGAVPFSPSARFAANAGSEHPSSLPHVQSSYAPRGSAGANRRYSLLDRHRSPPIATHLARSLPDAPAACAISYNTVVLGSRLFTS